MSIALIPVIGMVVTGIRVAKAQHAYSACHALGRSCWAEYDATWGPFSDFTVAYLATMSFFVLAIIVALIKASTNAIKERAGQ